MAIRRTRFERGTKIQLQVDGKAVSSLKVHDLRMRVGNVPLRCGGIGDVQTKREHRMEGYSRRVLEASIAFMGEQGYHLSALFGIANYYHKFGFASALMESELSVPTRRAEAAVPRYEVREFSPQDAQAIAEIYETMHAQRTASIVRDPATWGGIRRGSAWSERVAVFLVTNRAEVIGYASYNIDPWRYAIGEVGYVGSPVFSTLLAEAARRAVEARVERITFHLPPDEPFAQYCQRFGADIKLRYPHDAGGMARIINQTATLEAVFPVFARRLDAAGMADWNGTLLFETDLGLDSLRFGKGGKRYQVKMPHWMLAQLLLGYRSVDDAFLDSEVHADKEAIPILDTLFPQGYPYVCLADRF